MASRFAKRVLSTAAHMPPPGALHRGSTFGMRSVAGATALGTGVIAANIYSKQQELERLRKKGEINEARFRSDMETLATSNRARERKARERREREEEEEEELGEDYEGYGKRRSPYIPTGSKEYVLEHEASYYAPKTVGHGGSRRKHRGKTHRRKHRKNRKTRRN